MHDTALTVGAQAGAVAALVAVVALIGGQRLRFGWLVFALVAYAAYAMAIFHRDLLLDLPLLAPLRELLAKSEWNWGGKIVSFLTTLTMAAIVALSVRDGRSRMGFTFRQNPGSVLPALAMAAALLGASAALEIMMNDGTDLSADRILYQAVAPGLDEEPMFRGLLLFLLTQGLGGNERKLWHVGWGGVMATALFGLGHGMAFQDGVFVMSAFAIAITGTIGLGLLWIRERTGSLLLPILVHNAINVSLSFF